MSQGIADLCAVLSTIVARYSSHTGAHQISGEVVSMAPPPSVSAKITGENPDDDAAEVEQLHYSTTSLSLPNEYYRHSFHSLHETQNSEANTRHCSQNARSGKG